MGSTERSVYEVCSVNDFAHTQFNKIHICNEFTVWFMKLLGFEWREIDIAYLKGYIDYFRKKHFFAF